MDSARSGMNGIGVKVRVRGDYELAEFREKIGTVEQEYIYSENFARENYRILGVRLNDGRYELFWSYEVERAE